MKEHFSPLLIPNEDIEFVYKSIGNNWDRLRNKKLLLTGGTGFVGKWILDVFLHANRKRNLSAKVVLVSRDPDLFLSKFPMLKKFEEIHWIKKDIRQLSYKDVGSCSFAIHATTAFGDNASSEDIFDTCVVGMRNVIDIMKSSKGLKRMLFLSSGAVYGPIPSTIKYVSEDLKVTRRLPKILSAYAKGKRESENQCLSCIKDQKELEIVIARCFAFVGPHLPLNKHFAIGNFIDSALRDNDILIRGDGSPCRSYLYAADLTHWLWVLLFDGVSGRPYNVGSAKSISINELAHQVNKTLKGSKKILVSKKTIKGMQPEIYVPSTKRIQSEFALKPTVSLEEAILKTANWAKIVKKN